MEIKIRIAEEKDFAEILKLINELAVFENQTDQLVNSVERMISERNFSTAMWLRHPIRRLSVMRPLFFAIIPGWGNHCTWMICMYCPNTGERNWYPAYWKGNRLCQGNQMPSAKMAGVKME